MTTTKIQLSLNNQTETVGLGEVAITNDKSKSLACFGLGSCICLCVYDPVSIIAGMAHIVLPESDGRANADGNATKYADVAVPYLLHEMYSIGAVRPRLVVKLAGGAQMIQSADYNSLLEMGARNLDITEKSLEKEQVNIAASDTGGTHGRSVWMSVETGTVMVRKVGEEPKEL